MVNVSIKLEDLELITMALDSADFYLNDSEERVKEFFEHIDNLRFRLEKITKNWNEIKILEDKIEWNKTLIHLHRGFTSYDDFFNEQHKLLDEIRQLKNKRF